MNEKMRAELGIAVWDAVRHMMGVTLTPDDCEALGDQMVQSLRGAGLTITRIEDAEIARVRELVRSDTYRSRGGEDG